MKDLLMVIAKNLVDYPEAVSVTETVKERAIVLELKVAPEDMGKVIGKQGRITAQIIRAIENFSANRVGALMVFEKETSLMDIIETGTVIDAEISDQLLGNIFYEGAPLHDGALIIRQDRAYAAGCVLPLTHDKSISKDLGTRHRAAVGMSEVSDALIIAVSEETGAVSVAQGGKLARNINEAQLRIKLEEIQHRSSETNRIRAMWKGWREHAKKNN